MSLPSLVPFATLELLPDPSGRADGETYMGGTLAAVRGVVFHVNAGNGDPRNWWTNPSNPSVASAHLQIMKSGELRQYVPLNRVAWAEVAGNGEWHSVETEGFPTEPLTPAQFETFARLLAWGHVNCGWPLQVTDSPTGTGLGTHEMGGAAWGGHACPGPVRAGQRPALIARAQQLLTSPNSPGDDMPTPDDLFNAPIFTDGTPPNQDTVSFRRALDQIRQSPHDILDWLQNTTGGDLRLIVSLLQGQAQQIGGLTAALDKLAGSVATAQGNPGLADELRAVIHDEMTKVVQVQVSVANPTPAAAAPASTAAP